MTTGLVPKNIALAWVGARLASHRSRCHCAMHLCLLISCAVSALPAASSVYYQFEVVAESGQPTTAGSLFGIGDNPSINDRGEVAFVGRLSGGEGIFVASGSPTMFRLINPGFVISTRTLGRAAQINNRGQVVARPQIAAGAGVPARSFIRVWESSDSSGNAATDLFTTIAAGGLGSDPFEAIFSHPTINNNGHVAFSARASGTNLLVTPTITGFARRSGDSILRPAISDSGRIVVRETNAVTSPIQLLRDDLVLLDTIASAATGFTALGRSPGISTDGQIVVFAGDRGNGVGVFASIDDGTGPRKLYRIAGENLANPSAELGYDVAGSPPVEIPRNFQSVDLDSRIGITKLSPAGGGVVGSSFVVSFVGTPNGPSRVNPSTGQPLTFTDQPGIWTVRVDVDPPLGDELLRRYCITPRKGPGAALASIPRGDDHADTLSIDGGRDPNTTQPQINVITSGLNLTCDSAPAGDDQSTVHVRTPIPVIQIGDSIRSSSGDFVIDAFAVFDPLSAATHDDSSAPRSVRKGDHRVVFYAASGSTQFVIKGSHLDSDEDGLLDHWEMHGVDIDQDGAVDLDLAAMGADPYIRDMFIEIDWLHDRPGSHTNTPAPGVTEFVENLFRAAPETATGVPAGIKVHIDAGAGMDGRRNPLSRNMGGGSLRGGDRIGESGGTRPCGGTGRHVDVVYFGLSGSQSFPGVETRSFDEIKEVCFGTQDKKARELVFRYVVFADFHSFLRNGSGLIISGNVAASSPNTLNGGPFSLGLGGHAVMVTSGPGQGQIRKIVGPNTNTTLTVTPAWAITPVAGDTYILLNGSSGRAEAPFRWDFGPRAGNDVLVTLGNFGASRVLRILGSPFHQWQTLAHELGHTLGLRHGGVNHITRSCDDGVSPDAYKDDYGSLMNYAYQLFPRTPDPVKCPTRPGQRFPVMTYSSSADRIFSDWDHLQMGFFSSGLGMGNTLGLSGEALAVEDMMPELTVEDVERATGPIDLDEPVVSVDSPAIGAFIPLGTALRVRLTATDNVQVSNVTVRFDTNGDGIIDGAGETVTASLVAPNVYEASFGPILGAPGLRQVAAHAIDSSFHFGDAARSVSIVAAPTPVTGDLDGDGDVDQDDLNILLAARNTIVAPGDPRDLDGDGKVTALDARTLTTLCTRPRCATQ